MLSFESELNFLLNIFFYIWGQVGNIITSYYSFNCYFSTAITFFNCESLCGLRNWGIDFVNANFLPDNKLLQLIYTIVKEYETPLSDDLQKGIELGIYFAEEPHCLEIDSPSDWLWSCRIIVDVVRLPSRQQKYYGLIKLEVNS